MLRALVLLRAVLIVPWLGKLELEEAHRLLRLLDHLARLLVGDRLLAGVERVTP